MRMRRLASGVVDVLLFWESVGGALIGLARSLSECCHVIRPTAAPRVAGSEHAHRDARSLHARPAVCVSKATSPALCGAVPCGSAACRSVTAVMLTSHASRMKSDLCRPASVQPLSGRHSTLRPSPSRASARLNRLDCCCLPLPYVELASSLSLR